ncbi:peptidase [Bordetella genomosp. 1]|uniref:Peptidase n=1 Tax=Bordetella genomosp. 1 TaxID=1395607 RepID=A0A261SFF2_9BORD|nr:peptidoglycan DD-metalloendopeptidase family protein [Bordetella genomosp. 1]MDQ8032171.1 peptidoglycan DD-metalloendopeptidase family protein [Bordetella sp.]OZI35875.1 peptidase [Bordetella genomosp. 1]OZI58543.1 peptidase [Bordetella genomosp. 1]
MLNGQLQLTDPFLKGALAARLRRPALMTGLLCLAVLAGCTSTGKRAPVVDMTGGGASTSAQASGGTYVVKPGDTLYKIARANNVDLETVKRLNNLSDPNQIHVGQVLRVSGTATAGAGTSTTPIGSTKTEPRPLDQPAGTTPPTGTEPDTSTQVASGTPPPETPPKQPARAADAGVISWGWPSTGQISQTFNSNSKGIDFAGNPGDPVIAAADGKVMYSGNGVRGLGNLIIINHTNGFITAYAHNRALLVKTGQNVKRGTKIAEIGQTDATSPKLHFEIRRQGTPVDPLQYLPPR